MAKQQYSLGPHGMAYHLAEIMHRRAWEQTGIFYNLIDIDLQLAETVESIITDERGMDPRDVEGIGDILEEIKQIDAAYMPIMETDNGSTLRGIYRGQLIDIERHLLGIIKRNKLITQELLRSVQMSRPSSQGAGAEADSPQEAD